MASRMDDKVKDGRINGCIKEGKGERKNKIGYEETTSHIWPLS